jgi:hypothetical protein
VISETYKNDLSPFHYEASTLSLFSSARIIFPAVIYLSFEQSDEVTAK